MSAMEVRLEVGRSRGDQIGAMSPFVIVNTKYKHFCDELKRCLKSKRRILAVQSNSNI